VKSFVDKIVVIDGGSIDDTIFYLRNQDNVDLIISPWKDDFATQRNVYLSKVDVGDWVLVSDSDEWFPQETLREVRNLVEQGERENIYMFGFQCISITLKGDKISNKNIDNYWKGLLYKKLPGTRYISSLHETLVYGEGGQIIGYNLFKTSLYYLHVKQENVIWKRGVRNFFIGGGGLSLGNRNPSWVSFKDLLKKKTNITTWMEFHDYLVAGKIDEEIKKWMIEHRHEDGYDGASEVREVYKLYFRIYHPEEEPAELKNEPIK